MDTSNPNQPQIHQTVVVVGKQKSVGLAFILAFLFGPLGLLYASVTGGVVMFFAAIIIGFITLGFGLILVWIGCIIWAVVAAGNANKKMGAGPVLNINTNFGSQQPRQPIQQTQPKPEQKPSTDTFVPSPIADPHNQLSHQPQKVFQSANMEPPPDQSSFDLAKWFDKNKKSVFIGAGALIGLLILIVALKYVLSLDFGKPKKTNAETIQVRQPASQENVTPISSGKISSETTQTVQSTQSTSQENNNPTFQNGTPGEYPQASQRFLNSNDVKYLNRYQLKIMRNEIFARHGYIFKTAEMKSYFAQQTWYHGQYNDVNSMLSEIEKRNIDLIRKYE
ncbi:MAG: YARHG domain-containing protein [Ginsengibacter sp.]